MTIAEDYIPLARSLAKKYTPKGQHFETSDCLSVAYEALAAGCGRMEVRDKGASTYLTKTIEGALLRHLTAQRAQGFSGLKRSRYTEAILMDKDTDIPEELEAPLKAALSTTLGLDEPTYFDDGEQGSLVETVDPGVPSVEDEFLESEQRSYIKRELDVWKHEFLNEAQRAYYDEVMIGGKTQTQFRKERRITDLDAKLMREAITEEFEESAAYIYHNVVLP